MSALKIDGDGGTMEEDVFEVTMELVSGYKFCGLS
jgi:hypothetical protein